MYQPTTRSDARTERGSASGAIGRDGPRSTPARAVITIAGLALASGALASRGIAQPADSAGNVARPQPGERVRLTQVGPVQPFRLRGPRQVVGTLAAWSDSQVTVQREEGGQMRIPTRQIASVDVSRGYMTPTNAGIYGMKRGALLLGDTVS